MSPDVSPASSAESRHEIQVAEAPAGQRRGHLLNTEPGCSVFFSRCHRATRHKGLLYAALASRSSGQRSQVFLAGPIWQKEESLRRRPLGAAFESTTLLFGADCDYLSVRRSINDVGLDAGSFIGLDDSPPTLARPGCVWLLRPEAGCDWDWRWLWFLSWLEGRELLQTAGDVTTVWLTSLLISAGTLSQH